VQIEASRIRKGEPVEISRRVLGVGTPVSSYKVIDESESKVYSTTPVNLMTAEELLKDGYI